MRATGHKRTQEEESQQRETVDGKIVTLTDDEMERCAGSKICAGGLAFKCFTHKAHPVRWPKTVIVYFLLDKEPRERSYDVTLEESKRLYRCQHCGAYQGCGSCAPRPAALMCFGCKKWANRYGEEENGRL